LKDSASVTKFIEENEVSLIYFGDDKTDTYNAFKTVAIGFDNLPFGHIFGDKEVTEANKA